jgi:hypothetical protein
MISNFKSKDQTVTGPERRELVLPNIQEVFLQLLVNRIVVQVNHYLNPPKERKSIPF